MKFLANIFIALAIICAVLFLIWMIGSGGKGNTENVVLINESKLNALKGNVTDLRDRLQDKVQENLNLREENQRLKAMDRIEYNPEFEEVERIIEESDADRYEYEEGSYNCVEFSYDLISDFRDENIYSCITEIVFYDGYAHANVVVNTSDKGLVYIEPQDDEIIYDLGKGDDYCEKVNWDCEWEIKRLKTCFDFKDGEFRK